MKRTTIYLDDNTHEKVRKKAFEENISMAEIIRKALDKYFKEEK